MLTSINSNMALCLNRKACRRLTCTAPGDSSSCRRESRDPAHLIGRLDHVVTPWRVSWLDVTSSEGVATYRELTIFIAPSIQAARPLHDVGWMFTDHWGSPVSSAADKQSSQTLRSQLTATLSVYCFLPAVNSLCPQWSIFTLHALFINLNVLSTTKRDPQQVRI